MLKHMKIENTFIPDLKIIQLLDHKDERGKFRKIFNYNFFKDNGLETNFKEHFYSISEKNVIRGMHFQIPPSAQTKLVHVFQGSIIDVVLDLRKSSPTYGNYLKIKIDSTNPTAVYIPIGCAHGFLSLEKNTIVNYLLTSVYDPSNDMVIKYDSFGVDWGIENPILSTRDIECQKFSEITNLF